MTPIVGVDDKRLDDILADGIRGQTLEENKVTKGRDHGLI